MSDSSLPDLERLEEDLIFVSERNLTDLGDFLDVNFFSFDGDFIGDCKGKSFTKSIFKLLSNEDLGFSSKFSFDVCNDVILF